MKTKKNTPDIRFRGFTDDWEQRKLGKHAKLITKGTTPKDKSGNGDINFIKVENIANGVILPTSKTTIEEHENYLKRSILKVNDILFSIAGTLGRTAIVPESILPANTNQALAIIRDFDFDTHYLLIFLEGKAVKDYIRKNPTVGAQPNLSLEQVGNLKISSPKIEEQIKIGLFFDSINSTITLHQRKLQQLKEVKRGMLLKILPSYKNMNPSIRFNEDFDWRNEKLEFLITKNSEKNKELLINYVESISNKTGFTSQILQFEDYSVASKNLSNYYIIREKCFAYNPSRINVGSIAYKHKGDQSSVVSPLYVSFYTNQSLEDLYLWYWLKGQEFDRQREVYSEGGVRDTLSYNQLKEIKISYPDKKEQKLIGSLFEKLDRMIELQESEIELLEETKKGFLQKMFV